MNYVIPALVLFLICTAAIKGSNVYDSFISGAKKALPMLVSVLPYMAAMLCAIEIFRASGVMDLITSAISPVMNFLGIPPELTALITLRPFSGGAAMALLDDVLKNCGPDSKAGFLASVMLGSTETIFYTVALYFGAIGVKKTRHSIAVALISGVVGIVVSVWITEVFFGR